MEAYLKGNLVDIARLPGCINWVTVYKKITTYDTWCEEVVFVDNAGAEVSGAGWAGGSCPAFDYEKLVLCEAGTGNKVLVESWTDINDVAQARNARYTYLATNLPYTGILSDLVSCDTEQFDIQTKLYCDGWETVFGTLVFNVSWVIPVLVGVVFNKADGSVHTPVSPVEGACNAASVVWYNNVEHIVATNASPVTIAASTVHSITYQVIWAAADITIWWTTITYPATSVGNDEATELIAQSYTFAPSGSGVVIVRTIS